MAIQPVSNNAEPTPDLDPGPFLRQEGRPPRSRHQDQIRKDPAPLVVRHYPHQRASRVPVWISWVARRISLDG